MKLVADTNTFLAVALEEPEKDYLIQATTGHELTAPEILPFEIGNALSAMIKRKKLKINEAAKIWETMQKIDVELRTINIAAAINIAGRHNIYAYDAYFLECALNLKCPLLTLDRSMNVVARKLGIPLWEGEK